MSKAAMAEICEGECPYGYACEAMDCEKCAEIKSGGTEN